MAGVIEGSARSGSSATSSPCRSGSTTTRSGGSSSPKASRTSSTATKDIHRHILPTAALYSEAIVGRCCACEHAIVERQELEEQAIRLNNEAIRLENERLQARLDKKLFEKEFPPQEGIYLSFDGNGSPRRADKPA